jgi:hypothetical protein
MHIIKLLNKQNILRYFHVIHKLHSLKLIEHMKEKNTQNIQEATTQVSERKYLPGISSSAQFVKFLFSEGCDCIR